MVEIRVYFSKEMSKSFDKLRGKEKNKALILIRKIIRSEGIYQKETISTKNQSFYSSLREHVPERILWFKKGDEYYFVNYFSAHTDYDRYIDRIKSMNSSFSYSSVPLDLI